MKQFGIAYTQNGSLPPHDKIIGWKKNGGQDQIWSDRDDALEANDLDGWRGYVCEYPNGERPPYEN